jgi:hypothetical protein
MRNTGSVSDCWATINSLIETLQYSRTFELAEIRNFNGLRVSQSRPEGAECGKA